MAFLVLLSRIWTFESILFHITCIKAGLDEFKFRQNKLKVSHLASGTVFNILMAADFPRMLRFFYRIEL